ncbi:MAG: type IV pilus twitching motility protein PilT [Actinomycetota bacterium]
MTDSGMHKVAAPPPPPAGTDARNEPPSATAEPRAAASRPAPASAQSAEEMSLAVELPPIRKGADGRATIDDLLGYVVDVKSSDLHAKPAVPPTIRMSGQLVPLDHPVLTADECKEMAFAMMGEKEIATLADKGEVDFAYSLAGVSRFRVNVHRQRGTLGIAARRILPGAPDLDELGLPPAVRTLADEQRGLLLVTGPTSSGKTTTCGAIIRHINHSRRCHIVTVEDPIEILHEDELSVVTQREVGQDTSDFLTALRAAMRQDPDVIFVGEIRDTETVKAALQAAETGHLVLATLHTTDVSETVNRIIDFYPADHQKQIRVALAASLAGVISQRLLPKIDGDRAPAIEVMLANGRIRDCILNPEKTHEIHDIMAESDFYGMQTFDQALINLYRAKLVTLEDATAAATSPHDFHLALQQAGLLAV